MVGQTHWFKAQAHIAGEHLLLPWFGEEYPTLEIFSYDDIKETELSEVNSTGIAQIAFEVDDVSEMLTEIINAGGSRVGELITTVYPNNFESTFVYARDPEENILNFKVGGKHKNLF